jgi:hypothetical protein
MAPGVMTSGVSFFGELTAKPLAASPRYCAQRHYASIPADRSVGSGGGRGVDRYLGGQEPDVRPQSIVLRARMVRHPVVMVPHADAVVPLIHVEFREAVARRRVEGMMRTSAYSPTGVLAGILAPPVQHAVEPARLFKVRISGLNVGGRNPPRPSSTPCSSSFDSHTCCRSLTLCRPGC